MCYLAKMDVSHVQSGAKSSSDFSIERILSEDSRTRDGPAESPSWLCCTRYRPPRLPRASSNSACRPRRSGRHARVPFTAVQAAALEAAYARAPYLAPPALRALAAALQLRDDRIKIWFQNRRARERKEKCSSVVPPNTVTLPPTTGSQGHLNSNTVYININQDAESVLTPANFASQPFVTSFFSHQRKYSESSEQDTSDSPLDIETVEDNE